MFKNKGFSIFVGINKDAYSRFIRVLYKNVKTIYQQVYQKTESNGKKVFNKLYLYQGKKIWDKWCICQPGVTIILYQKIIWFFYVTEFPIKLILHLELKYDNGSTKKWSNSMTWGNCRAGKMSVMGVTNHVKNLQSFSSSISPFNLKLFYIIFPKVDVCMYATIWYRCSEVSQKVSSDQRVICEFEELSADQKTIRGSKNCGICRSFFNSHSDEFLISSW